MTGVMVILWNVMQLSDGFAAQEQAVHQIDVRPNQCLDNIDLCGNARISKGRKGFLLSFRI